MSHYNKKNNERLLSKIRNGYAKYIRTLMAQGTPRAIIEWTNNSSVRFDMVVLLGRELRLDESNALLQAPENNTRFGKDFVRAHATAKTLQDARQGLRRMLREFELNKTRVYTKLNDVNDVLAYYG